MEKESKLFIKRIYFNFIKTGQKPLELRLKYPSLNKIKDGSIITFLCGNESQKTKVFKRTEYSSFREVVKNVDFKKIVPDCRTEEEFLNIIHGIYPPEKAKKFGIVIFEITLY